MNDQMDKAMQQQDSKRKEMPSCQRLWQPLIVPRQPAQAGGPGETALHHPASGQENNASLGLRQLDHFQADALLRRCLQGLVSGRALVPQGDFHTLARHGWSLGRQLGNRLTGRRAPQRQALSQRIEILFFALKHLDRERDSQLVQPLIGVLTRPRLSASAFQEADAVLAFAAKALGEFGAGQAVSPLLSLLPTKSPGAVVRW